MEKKNNLNKKYKTIRNKLLETKNPSDKAGLSTLLNKLSKDIINVQNKIKECEKPKVGTKIDKRDLKLEYKLQQKIEVFVNNKSQNSVTHNENSVTHNDGLPGGYTTFDTTPGGYIDPSKVGKV